MAPTTTHSSLASPTSGMPASCAETDTLFNRSSNASMLAASAAIWTDYFTINSALAAGTVVQAMASIDMEGIADVSEGAIGPDGGPLANRTDAFWSFFASMQNLNNPSDYGFLCADWQDPVCLLPPNVPFESHSAVTFDLVVGDVTEITGLMQVSASSGDSCQLPGRGGQRFSHLGRRPRAHFFLQPLGDFTLVSSSQRPRLLAVGRVTRARRGAGANVDASRRQRRGRDAGQAAPRTELTWAFARPHLEAQLGKRSDAVTNKAAYWTTFQVLDEVSLYTWTSSTTSRLIGRIPDPNESLGREPCHTGVGALGAVRAAATRRARDRSARSTARSTRRSSARSR